MKDTRKKSLSKAISWRVLATLTTMIISYFITGRIAYALSIGSLEFVFKIVLYYFHERLWGFSHLKTKALIDT
jgi:uncharacterized membrane protein